MNTENKFKHFLDSENEKIIKELASELDDLLFNGDEKFIQRQSELMAKAKLSDSEASELALIGEILDAEGDDL